MSEAPQWFFSKGKWLGVSLYQCLVQHLIRFKASPEHTTLMAPTSNVKFWSALTAPQLSQCYRSVKKVQTAQRKATVAFRERASLLIFVHMKHMMMRAFPEGSIICSAEKCESEWEGGCSYLYIYSMCALLRAHRVWRNQRMYKVPFMLWSPPYLPKHQPGRYDVRSIFTSNSIQLAF